MSKTYNIECDDCKKTLWIGQGDYIYTSKPEIDDFAKFLHSHIGHKLKFVNDDYVNDDYEDLSNYE